MGKIGDAMQNLVDEIRSSIEARNAALRELSEKTEQLMKDIHNANQTQAKALREKLSSEEKARVEATQQFMEEIGIKVSEIRSGTHNLLERFRLEHRDMAKALREKLSSEEKARVEATQQFMEEVHKINNERRQTVREMLNEVASDLRQARKMWTEGVKKKIIPEAAAKEAVEEVEEKPKVEAAPPLSDKEKILDVIARHPEGIKLVDIGNELGVDWRTLIGPIKSLVDEDKVEKIDTMYYPKKEK